METETPHNSIGMGLNEVVKVTGGSTLINDLILIVEELEAMS